MLFRRKRVYLNTYKCVLIAAYDVDKKKKILGRFPAGGDRLLIELIKSSHDERTSN